MGIFGRPDKPGVDYPVGAQEGGGVTLTPFTGTIQQGYTYEDKIFNSEATVAGLDGVHFENCKILTSGNYGLRSFRKNGLPDGRNITGNYVTVEGPGTGVYGPGISIDHILIQNVKDDFIKTGGGSADPGDRSLYRYGMVRLGGLVSTSHADGDQISAGGGWVHFEEFNFNMPYPGSPGAIADGQFNHKSNANIFASVQSGDVSNVTMNNCWCNGGNYTNYFQYHGQWNGSARLRNCWATNIWFGVDNAFYYGSNLNPSGLRSKTRERILNTRLVTSTDEFYALNWFWESDNEVLDGIPTGSAPTPPTILLQSSAILPRLSHSSSIIVPSAGDIELISRGVLPRISHSATVRVLGPDVVRRTRFLPLYPTS